jgi:DNA repair protein RecO (recombination protein O)
LGFCPELYKCLNCHKKIALEKNYFSYKKGGIVCSKCQNNTMGAVSVSNSAIKLMRIFLEKDLDQIAKIKYNKNLHQETKNIINDFLRYHLER